MILHDSSTPLYLQLAAQLEKSIYDGTYRPGDKLPSESEMCRAYQLSRITVRQTLSILTQKGLIYSVHGKGTFVKIPLINHELTKIVRFATSLQQKGLAGYTKVHSFYPESDNGQAFSVLGCEMCNLNLIGYAQDTPVVHYRSYVRAEMRDSMYAAAKGFEMQHTAFSSYDLYDKLGIRLHRVEQTLGAVNADDELNAIFGSAGNPALILLESTYYSHENVPLEFKVGFYRSDIYTFHLQRELD